MKWKETRRYVSLILVLGALLPAPWWAEVPTLKLLSMGMLIAGMQTFRTSRRESTTVQADQARQNDGSVDRRELKRALLLVSATGTSVAVTFVVLTLSAQSWPVYLFAATLVAFFWTLSGLLMRLFQ